MRELSVNGILEADSIRQVRPVEGWRVQWESVPPGQKSEPCNWGRIRGGNEADEADRQSHLQDGEQVTGP